MENFEPIELQQARDFSKKINATFAFLRQNIKNLSRSLLYIAGPPALLGSVLASSIYGGIFDFGAMARRGADMEGPAGIGMFTSPGFWLEILGVIVSVFFAILFTISVVNNYIILYGEKKSNQIEPSEVWDRVRETFWMYVETIILITLAGILSYVVMIVPMALIFTQSPALIGVAVLIMIILMVFMIYFWVVLSMVFFIRAYERIGFFDSVRRAFKLIRDKWWSTFGVIFVTSFIAGSMAALFFIPWYANMIITMFHSMETNSFEEPSTFSKIFNNLFLTLYFLASFLLRAIMIVGLAFQYFNLVELKEAKGLMERINTVGQSPTSDNTKDEQY